MHTSIAMKQLHTLLFILATTNLACACKCLPLPFEQEVESSSSIFHGRVISADQDKYEIEIIQMWKGNFTTNTFLLQQGKTSCERKTFDVHKEYLFYVRGSSVFNCSRTDEYALTIDSELLDLKFKGIGNKDSIQSNTITEREITIIKSWLEWKNIDTSNVSKELLFAIEDKWVDKWTFFDRYRWMDVEIRLTKLAPSDHLILWIGTRWDKSLKKLKKSM